MSTATLSAKRAGTAHTADRIASVDIIRGVVMVLMAIDHVRVYSGLPAGGATIGIFFTRWITHFCAPAFLFLAGTSAFLYTRTHADLSRQLLIRGAWLILLELTVLRVAWTFNLDFAGHEMAGVIWVIGWCMILMAGLITLPVAAVGAIGVIIIAAHNLLDSYVAALVPTLGNDSGAALWKILYVAFFAGPIELLRSSFADFSEQSLPEVVDLTEAGKTIGHDAMYVDPRELHRIDDGRILRYDLTLPLLLTVRYNGRPLRLWTSGKAYRAGQVDAMHLEAFHQAEALWLDERGRLNPWQLTGRVLQSVDRVLPGRIVKIVPTEYAMCSQAWELEVDNDGQWSEVLAWGVFTDRIVRHLGGDPSRHIACGVGYGLERLAMLRYGIDDVRKIDVASVA